jgi:hypothetical protein
MDKATQSKYYNLRYCICSLFVSTMHVCPSLQWHGVSLAQLPSGASCRRQNLVLCFSFISLNFPLLYISPVHQIRLFRMEILLNLKKTLKTCTYKFGSRAGLRLYDQDQRSIGTTPGYTRTHVLKLKKTLEIHVHVCILQEANLLCTIC